MDSDSSTFPVVAIGGSAGALEPLQRIAADLPDGVQAAIFITTHVPASSVSSMPAILSRCGALFATHAIDGAPIAPGRIIVAPPGDHLVVERGVMRVVSGPEENGHRPSIDVLFRSAATAYGSRACGFLLSGTLDDGVAGLAAIRQSGGRAFAQDPDDAMYPDLPRNAIRANVVDEVLAAAHMVEALERWMRTGHNGAPPLAAPIAQDERTNGSPSVFTCPDCGGTLWEVDDQAVLRFRCRTGHAYSGDSMLYEHSHSLEQSLWGAIRALEERQDLLRRIARRTARAGDKRTAARYERHAEEARAQMGQVQFALDTLARAKNPS